MMQVCAAGMALATLPFVITVPCVAEPSIVQAVRVDDERELMERLLDVAELRLSSAGLSLKRRHAQMSLVGAKVPAGEFEVRSMWSAREGIPAQPLRFELRPADGSAPREAFLAVPLLRDVPVTLRRLRKGAAFACDDVTTEARPLRPEGRSALLELPCLARDSATVLRDLGVGQVVRATDVGHPCDVYSGSRVAVTSTNRGIAVTVEATALSDARVGDHVDVRLQRPRRTLAAVVTGPGTARLQGDGT